MNNKFVLVIPNKNVYIAYEGRKKVLKVQSNRPLMPKEVEDYRANPHFDSDYDGEDPDGDLVA